MAKIAKRLACFLGLHVLVVSARHFPKAPSSSVPLRGPGRGEKTALASLRGGGLSPLASATLTQQEYVSLAAAAVVAVAAFNQKPGEDSSTPRSTSSENGAASGGDGGGSGNGGGGGGAGAGNGINTVQSTWQAGAPPRYEVLPGAEEGFWHALDTERCVAALGATSGGGLLSSVATNRLLEFGANELQAAPRTSVWQMIAEQFEDRLVQILLCVAVFSALTSSLEAGSGSGLSAFIEPAVILTILVLNAAVGVWQGQSAEGALDALQKMQPSLATVLRDGAWVAELNARDLVPGDIVQLRVGDKVPADCRLLKLQSSTFNVDEGSLTGESATVSKSLTEVEPGSPIQGKTNMVFSGTMVTVGNAYALVVATGMRTEMGTISKGVQAAKAEETKTPLGLKLDEFGEQLSWIIGWVCLGVWVINVPRFSAPAFGSGVEGQLRGAMHYLKVAVALGVAAIPEGLPAVITLCLSLGTRRMAQRNVIVRKLPSVETLGCTTVICSDKTGTLTQNQMTSVSVVLPVRAEDEAAWLASAATSGDGNGDGADATSNEEDAAAATTDSTSEAAVSAAAASAVSAAAVTCCQGDGKVSLLEHSVFGLGYSPVGSVAGIQSASQVLVEVMEVCVLCNDAALFYSEAQFQRTGEPTEAALKVLAEKLGNSDAAMDERAEEPGSEEEANALCKKVSSAVEGKWKRLATLEFNRNRKSMSVLVRPATSDNASWPNKLCVKGAPDMLLKRCSKVMLPSGAVLPLTPALRTAVNAKIDAMAKRPLRTIGFAMKGGKELGAELGRWGGQDGGEGDSTAVPKALTDPAKFEAIESDLTFLGLTGIKDPARAEVSESILRCKEAGVRVMMITGDSKPTACAIARDVGIFSSQEYEREEARLLEGDGSGSGSVESTRAFTGAEFFQGLSEKQQMATLAKGGNLVFCRTEPLDKQKLVKMLQKLGEVPAMTGDGVNDAPALQQAAIGIAMGISGTEVAKEAADMVLADDNFATIVAAVEEGRCIYNNMQSFICFLISCNFGEIATIFFATILGLPEPLTPLQLLWVNLVTDGPPATALGFNLPSPDAMRKPPRSTSEPILSAWLLIRYVVTGLYVGGATLGCMVWWLWEHGVSWRQMCTHTACSSGSEFAKGLVLKGDGLESLLGVSGLTAGAAAASAVAEVASTVAAAATSAAAAAVAGAGAVAGTVVAEAVAAGTVGASASSLIGGAVDPCLIFQGKAQAKVQTLALSALVAMEMLKALSAVSVNTSLLRLPPYRNKFLMVAVAVPSLLHFSVVHFPEFGSIFGLTPLTKREWAAVAWASLPILLLEEVLKCIGRGVDRRAAAKAEAEKKQAE